MMKHVANLKACIFIYPYLNQPFRHTYRHGCIAGYYHLMPTASSMQALDYLTMFLSLMKNRLSHINH
ncbi:MAG: hypothetical protein II597_01975 [Prevotella sp.]|nr:hypothetical protein [Prevotella sp.]